MGDLALGVAGERAVDRSAGVRYFVDGEVGIDRVRSLDGSA